MGYWNNRLYVALPMDQSTVCNAVVVYNFITDQWFGEWTFDASMNMNIMGWEVADYLGLQRLHAITEDGRIFITGRRVGIDISGAIVTEIPASVTTRAYDSNDLNNYQRRLFVDIYTNRPELSVSSYSDGVAEESVLLTNQTYTRAESWLYNDSAYDLTNANDDYNRAYRKDYATGPANVQCGSGFLPEAISGNPQALARFEREAQAVAALNHPNIVGIHDSGTAAGNFYFVMDYISGEPLDAWMTGGERSIEETLRLFMTICEAVLCFPALSAAGTVPRRTAKRRRPVSKNSLIMTTTTISSMRVNPCD
jgi:hypothetical protein